MIPQKKRNYDETITDPNMAFWQGHEESLRKLIKEAKSIVIWDKCDVPEEWKTTVSYPPLLINPAVLSLVPQGRMGLRVCFILFNFNSIH